MQDSIKVFAPATVANVTCGFDILGFAVDQPGDEITLKKNDSGHVKIIKITGDDGALPMDPDKNTSGVVIKKFLSDLGSSQGVEDALSRLWIKG